MNSAADRLRASTSCFGQVVADHLPMIRRIVAAHESNASRRDDVVQDVLYAIWRALPTFRGEGSLRAFIARIAANRAVTHVQHLLRLPETGGLTSDIAACEPGPEAHAIAIDEHERLLRALRNLPIGLREPALLALGFSWRASVGDTTLLSSRIETRLKMQSAFFAGATALGATISVLGFALAAWTLWIGWASHTWNSLTRGATLGIVSFLAALATSAIRRRDSVETRSVREMLQALGARTERLIRAVDLACCSVVVLAVGGTVGYALRNRFGHPPSMPLMEDLLMVALAGVAIAWYRRIQTHALRRYRQLEQAIGSGDSA